MCTYCVDINPGLMDQIAGLVTNRREIEHLQEQISLVHTELLVKREENEDYTAIKG